MKQFKVITGRNSSYEGKIMCDIIILICRITITVYHVDTNSVLLPQLSASYETRTAQQLSRLLFVFNYIEIFTSAPHPQILRFLMNT